MKRFSLVAFTLIVVLLAPFALSSAQNTSAATIQLEGLHAPVKVRRDERGIPYIEAANDEDIYFAQGYVTASDRLWQMDVLRRTVRGQLCEIFGAAALSQDKLHRTFGFAEVVDETAKHLPPNLNLALNAYAKGVNAFIASRTPKTLPPEFQLLQYQPQPWTPADSLAVGKILAEYLSTTWQLDVMRASLANLPKEKRDALLPETSPLDVILVGKDGTTRAHTIGAPASNRLAADARLLQQLSELIETEQRSFELIGLTPLSLDTLQASNNWVVSGKRTTTGKPLLANDPHIPAAAPGIWYQTALVAPGLHVAGVTFPGAPGIVLGHNERIAWGATNLGPDVQDVYREKFDKDHSTRYQTPSGWREAEIRHEPIKVRKNPADPASIEIQTLDVTVTRHGPIVLEKDGNRYALRWTALDPTTMESSGLFDANRARNWKEFTAALSHYSGPTQNFVYADVDGHIGYYGAGRIPIRKSGDGSVPYDGSRDEGEWAGFLSFDKLPHSFDPPSGIIVTANQRVVGQDYPYFLSHVWAPPYRARRIFDLLSAKPKLSTDDLRTVQADVYSIGNVTFARGAAKILSAAGPDDQTSKLISELQSWDGMMSADSHAAVLVLQMRNAFRQRILNTALAPELAKNYFWPESDVLVDHLIADQPHDWLPKEFGSYAELLRACYQEARQTLTKNLGADESKWTWGALTKSRFSHPLASVPFIGAQFAIEAFPQNGSGGSINVGSSVSMRLIADTSDWDKTLNGIPLGESGLPSSPHWKDQLTDWRSVTPRAFPFTKAAVESAAREAIVLTPKQ